MLFKFTYDLISYLNTNTKNSKKLAMAMNRVGLEPTLIMNQRLLLPKAGALTTRPSVRDEYQGLQHI
jgi:hypothetical protein